MKNIIQAQDYYQLLPDTVISATESMGYLSDARILALNSYENRVYQVGIEEHQPLIAKFYRPGRWSDEQILEEHKFTIELDSYEIPVVPPLTYAAENTAPTSLHYYQGYRFALYNRRSGRAPELTDPEHLYWLGKFIGRIHAVSKTGHFVHRPTISIADYIIKPRDFLIQHDFIPDEYRPSYQAITDNLLTFIETIMAQSRATDIRLHGDCHPGNILWTEKGPHFVDFDDCRSGPAIQDLWMLLSGERHEQQQQVAEIIDGYNEFCTFNPQELNLIEALRTMRIIHYAGWLAMRWSDPAFPRAFPWFNSPNFWGEHILQLKEQLAALQEPPIQIYPIV